MHRMFWPYLPVLLGIAVSLSGCIAVPIPMPPREDDEVLTQGKITFLSEPDTTRPKVEETLGEPDYWGGEPDGFVGGAWNPRVYFYRYNWRTSEVIWLGIDGGSGLDDHDRRVMVLIEFDEDNHVARYGCYNRPQNKSPYKIIDDFLSYPIPKYLTKQVQLPKE